MGRRGFALAYVLVVVTVLVTFFSAVLVRATQTMRVANYDFELVQARGLADLGAELAFNLFREDPDWYKNKPQPFPSSFFGIDDQEFEVSVVDREDLDEDPFPSNGGTYKLIVARARVGGRQARTTLSIKLTNPMVNHLVTSRGDYRQKPWVGLDGPVFIDSDPELGIPGTYQFVHTVVSGNPPSITNRDAEFAGEVRATGSIFLQSDAAPAFLDQPPEQLRGDLPVGATTHDDVNEAAAGGGVVDGRLVITRPSKAEPMVEMGLQVAAMKELLGIYRSRRGEVEQVDVSGAAEGVLVEFLDNGEVVVSRAGWREVGRCYDRSIYLAAKDQTDPGWTEDYALVLNRNLYGSAQAEAVTRREVAWNDPCYPDDVYPPALLGNVDADGDGTAELVMGSDLDGDGAAEQGDYFEVKRITRGSELARFGLSRSRWTVIYLYSSRADYPTADVPPKETAPPVFVRGVVRGKAVVVYDAADDSVDPVYPAPEVSGSYSRFHVYVHSDHEHPDDNPSRQLQAHGVPGGLHYADRRFKTAPDDTGSASDDGLVLLSRGSLRGSGLGGFNLSWLVEGNNRVNYRDLLRRLDERFVSHYGDESYRLCALATADQDWPLIPFDGIGIGHWSYWNRDRVRHDGMVVVEKDDNQTHYARFGNSAPAWQSAFASWPAGVSPAEHPVLPLFMRCASAPEGCDYRVAGGVHSVGVPLALNGKGFYDYRWRDLTAEEIEEEIKLPVGPLLLERSRR